MGGLIKALCSHTSITIGQAPLNAQSLEELLPLAMLISLQHSALLPALRSGGMSTPGLPPKKLTGFRLKPTTSTGLQHIQLGVTRTRYGASIRDGARTLGCMVSHVYPACHKSTGHAHAQDGLARSLQLHGDTAKAA